MPVAGTCNRYITDSREYRPKGLSDTTTFCAIESPVKKILKHLDLWDLKARTPPKTNAPPSNIHIDKSDSQVPPCEDYLYCDPDYLVDAYAQG